MLYIVIEESQGFGEGGWDIGYYVHLIREGKVFKKIRYHDIEPVMLALRSLLKEFGIEYKVRRIGYPPKGDDFCKQLIKVLCKETKDD